MSCGAPGVRMVLIRTGLVAARDGSHADQSPRLVPTARAAAIHA
jgi:hypothetical protein